MIAWLHPGADFPSLDAALTEPNGLLAASAHLDASTLVRSYARGIFPWYSEGDPILWWSPDPRMVLKTDEIKVSRSLRKTLKTVRDSTERQIYLNRDFAGTMRACAAPREDQEGTWITPTVLAAYQELHRLGLAHSAEVWRAGTLVGGAYGVSLGRMFFGESMFARETDASKIALCALVSLLRQEAVAMIDCQQKTAHLASLGAREIPRDDFIAHVEANTSRATIAWSKYQKQALNHLLDPLLTD
jgi:leucyl/phenylalanyl-tRNA--protein transferase